MTGDHLGRYVPADFATRTARADHGCPWCGWWGGVNAGEPHEAVTCLACGTPQCKNHDRCRACLYGWLPGWWRRTKVCGCAGCDNDAVAKAPRVERVCAEHLARPKVNGRPLADVIAQHRAEALTDAGGQRARWRRMVWRTVQGHEDSPAPAMAPIPGAG